MLTLLDVKYVWIGLKDYLRSLSVKGSPTEQKVSADTLALPFKMLSGVIGVILLALLAKMLSPLTTLGNVDGFTSAVSVGFVAGAVLFFVVLPAYVVIRFFSFIKRLHARGKAICLLAAAASEG